MINLIKFLISALKNKKKNTERFKWTNEILIMKRFHNYNQIFPLAQNLHRCNDEK